MSPAILLLLLAPAAGPPAPVDMLAVPHPVAFHLAARDLASLPRSARYYQRYLFVPSWGDNRRRVQILHQNLLARQQSEIQRPVWVTPWLWRIDLRYLRWDAGQYENAFALHPYFHRDIPVEEKEVLVEFVWPGGKDRQGKFYGRQKYRRRFRRGQTFRAHSPHLPPADVQFLRLNTYSEVPVLRADWLFAQQATQQDYRTRTDSGLGYYDVLGLKTRADYLRLIDLDVPSPKRVSPFGREFRAALEFSGVSPRGRQIVRFQGRGGGAWVTLDIADPAKSGNPTEALEPGELKHEAEEWFGFHPSNLPVIFTSNQNGVRADVVPGDRFGLHDHSALNESNRKAIDPALSCWQCHAGAVLRDFTEDVRKINTPGTWLALGAKEVRARQAIRGETKNDQFRRLYLSDIYFWLARDRADYQRAIRQATVLDPADPLDMGLEPQAAMAAYARAYHSFVTDPVTLTRAAREVGLNRAVFLDALRYYARPKAHHYRLVRSALARFLAREPLPISRTTWEGNQALVQDVLVTYAVRLDRIEKAKRKEKAP